MPSWYLFIHTIPPKPLYLRAKVRQRLERIGAVALKNSVYVLPEGEDTLEDLEWLAGEITSGGGQAFIASGRLLAGVTEDDLITAFRTARDADYAALMEELRNANSAMRERLRRRFDEIREIDFFDAPKRKEAEKMLAKLERPRPRTTNQKSPVPSGATWVTRTGIKVDRIASAWLVRRFLDPDARFRFVDPQSWKRKAGEIAFDMTGGDYTHEGDRCTFETLMAKFAIRDRAVQRIAEIVHDIHLKDEKFGRPEAAGIRQLLEGILATHSGDEQRLDRGFALLDDLYRSFQSRARR